MRPIGKTIYDADRTQGAPAPNASYSAGGIRGWRWRMNTNPQPDLVSVALRRVAARGRLAAANKALAIARGRAAAGEAEDRERAESALREAREAREELARFEEQAT